MILSVSLGAGTLAGGLLTVAWNPSPPTGQGGCGSWEMRTRRVGRGPQFSQTIWQQMLHMEGDHRIHCLNGDSFKSITLIITIHIHNYARQQSQTGLCRANGDMWLPYA